MNIILFDNPQRATLFPLTFTTAVAQLRAGIFTIKERWHQLSGRNVFIHTASYLQPLYETVPKEKSLWVDASVLADKALADKILSIGEGSALYDEFGLIACILNIAPNAFEPELAQAGFKNAEKIDNTRRLQYPWQLFQWNDALLREDFDLVKATKQPQPLPPNNQYINAKDIFVEEGAEMLFSTINASTGPIYIGKGAVVMEGSAIRGPFALNEGAAVKMGAKIYGATTIGPYCVAGGEIKNTIMQGYSNKGHDGYLGDAIIGSWCNLGAGTTNSNVKNNASMVKMWSYATQQFVLVGTKAGVVMGDYTRTAINTSLNTGTVAGVCCNLFDGGGGLLPKYIPNFSWGGAGGGRYMLEKALENIANWKKMKHQTLSHAEAAVLKHIFGGDF